MVEAQLCKPRGTRSLALKKIEKRLYLYVGVRCLFLVVAHSPLVPGFAHLPYFAGDQQQKES